MISYVLDACAFIAFLKDEEGHTLVDNIFKNAIDGKCKVFLHKATLLEVYYEFFRSSGKPFADNLLSSVASQPIILINKMDNRFIQNAGYYKVSHKISFADCFVLALATIKKATIISSDHHEFDAIEKSSALQFSWIR